MSSLFEETLTAHEDTQLFEILGGYPLATHSYSTDCNTGTDQILDFFKNLSTEERLAYHHISEIAIDPPDQDKITLLLNGFNPVEYAEFLAMGLHLTDPDRRSNTARNLIFAELDLLKSWISLQASSNVRPILAIEAAEGMPDTSRIAWFPYPDRLNYGFNSGEKGIRTINRELKCVYEFLMDPEAENRNALLIRKTAAKQMLQYCSEGVII